MLEIYPQRPVEQLQRANGTGKGQRVTFLWETGTAAPAPRPRLRVCEWVRATSTRELINLSVPTGGVMVSLFLVLFDMSRENH
jgi:hypothetical protein